MQRNKGNWFKKSTKITHTDVQERKNKESTINESDQATQTGARKRYALDLKINIIIIIRCFDSKMIPVASLSLRNGHLPLCELINHDY